MLRTGLSRQVADCHRRRGERRRPAAAASYVDPRVVDLHLDGVMIPEPSARTRERSGAAVLELLADASGR
ncbi:hypothetical protein GCM10027610_005590 [Dactylosporangium cerinum]